MRFLSRKRPPGINYEKGIPLEQMTMIVVPVLVSEIQEADRYITKLEETYLANVDAGLIPNGKHLFQLDWEDFDSWLENLKQSSRP